MVRNMPDKDVARTVIIQKRDSQATVEGRLSGVLHGQIESGTPGSLIVFDFQFGSKTIRNRIKSASVSIIFTGQAGDSDRGPNVVDLAPQGSMRLFPHTTHETRTRAFSPSIEVGGITGGIGWEREITKSRQSAMLLRGGAAFQGRDRGEPNAAQWFLENDITRDGLTCKLRCAVLLARTNSDPFQAKVTVKATVSGVIFQGTHLLGQQDDPVPFNPKTDQPIDLTGGKLRGVNSGNLEKADLKSFAYLDFHAEHLSLDLTEDLPGPERSLEDGPPISSGEWKEGKTRDQILLGFARGEYDSSFQFNSFNTISIFNLYLYQHRLVKLEKELKKKISDGGEIVDAEADNLARLLREYHEALKAFKELSAYEGLPSQIARNTTVEMRAKLDDHNYSCDSDLSMIDLLGEPTKDDVRGWVQKRLNHLQSWIRKDGTEEIVTTAKIEPEVNVLGMGAGNIGVSYERRQTRLLASSDFSQPRLMGISPTADKLAGFLVAFVGGAFLIAPMCELAYVESKKWQIISVVLWVLFFAFSVVATSKAKNVELLGATAAYAAVLVVFVGQSQT
ncbi:hypothetical protein Hte_000441 [Hypoxylon texense]